MPYIGRPLNAGNLAVQSGTGDGSDTTPIATLDFSVGSSNSIGVYLDGVRQLAGTDFTASGTTLTFTTAPANGVGIDVYFLGLELSIPTPADGTVTTAKIAANAVDETKLKDALVADFTEVTVAAGDSILLGDATDSGNTKRDTVQGILDLAVHTGNVAFPATQVASADANTLDDYEEGTFTIAQTFGSGSSAVASQFASYVKIGKWVFINAYYQNGSSSSPSGQMNVTGLPFTTSGGAYFHVIIWNTLASATGSSFFAQYSGGTSFPIWEETNSAGRFGDAGAYMNYHDGPYVGFNFAYQTA